MTENQRRKRAAERVGAISESDYAMSTAEIATLLSCTHQNVSVSIMRSFKKIKKALMRRGIGQKEVRTILED